MMQASNDMAPNSSAPRALAPHQVKKRPAEDDGNEEQILNKPKLSKGPEQLAASGFFSLPGELRNMVYAFVEDDLELSVMTAPPRKKQRARRNFEGYDGLAQTCRRTHSEFRPIWIGKHRIPLRSAEKYVKTFFPRKQRSPGAEPAPVALPLARRVRIVAPPPSAIDVDIQPLLKRPDVQIAFQNLYADPKLLTCLQDLVDNRNANWLNQIRHNRITQVRVVVGRGFETIRVVFKDRYKGIWNRPCTSLSPRSARRLATDLGLEFAIADVWDLAIGLDYS